MTEELNQSLQGIAKVARAYDALTTDTDQWYFPRVLGLLVLADLCRFPDCYSKKAERNYRAMANRWGISATDLAPGLGQQFQALATELGLTRSPPPAPTGPLRGPTGRFLRQPEWLRRAPN